MTRQLGSSPAMAADDATLLTNSDGAPHDRPG
jgi:hypothetical protein